MSYHVSSGIEPPCFVMFCAQLRILPFSIQSKLDGWKSVPCSKRWTTLDVIQYFFNNAFLEPRNILNIGNILKTIRFHITLGFFEDASGSGPIGVLVLNWNWNHFLQHVRGVRGGLGINGDFFGNEPASSLLKNDG